MSMTTEQLRTALGDLNGLRNVRFVFEHAETLLIHNALLVPVEEDRIVKLTDGSREYFVDSQRIAWVEIGTPHAGSLATPTPSG